MDSILTLGIPKEPQHKYTTRFQTIVIIIPILIRASNNNNNNNHHHNHFTTLNHIYTNLYEHLQTSNKTSSPIISTHIQFRPNNPFSLNNTQPYLPNPRSKPQKWPSTTLATRSTGTTSTTIKMTSSPGESSTTSTSTRKWLSRPTTTSNTISTPIPRIW